MFKIMSSSFIYRLRYPRGENVVFQEKSRNGDVLTSLFRYNADSKLWTGHCARPFLYFKVSYRFPDVILSTRFGFIQAQVQV